MPNKKEEVEAAELDILEENAKNEKDIESGVYPTEPTIVWTRWEDIYEKIVADSKKMAESSKDQWTDSEGNDELEPEELYSQPLATIMTPFGVLPIGKAILASTNLKFWIGHTNFKITRNFVKDLAEINGIEDISLLTPHRFRICIGHLFRDRQVMADIKSIIKAPKPPAE